MGRSDMVAGVPAVSIVVFSWWAVMLAECETLSACDGG